MTSIGVYDNILSLIGNTPIVKLGKFSPSNGATIYAKLEWYNIGGSIKDRIVLGMFKKALENGKLSKDKVIIEASSGNTGIALAMLGTYYGYKVKIMIPESASLERRKILAIYGAEVILTKAEDGTAGAIEMKNKLLRESPDRYISFDQFSDPTNYKVHYETTANEILKQMDGKIDTFVVGIGTGGTGVGCSMRLKANDPAIKIIGIIPDTDLAIPGLRNPNEQNPSKIYAGRYFDQIQTLNKDDLPRIKSTIKEVASKEGLLIGPSSAAVLYIAKKAAGDLDIGKRVLTILADNGLKYLSTDYIDII